MKKQKPKRNKAKKAPRQGKTNVVYLDYASATPISPIVQAAMSDVSGVFANPGGIHALSVEAKKTVEDARRRIAELIEARPEEIVFTASATESNWLAIRGAVETWKDIYPGEIPHIIISAIEHPSVIEAAAMLEDEGAEVTKISVDELGMVLVPELKAMLKPNTVIVSVMTANNEIGTIQPIYEITKTLRHYKKEIKFSGYPLFHTDAAQAFQYVPIRAVKPEVDLMTISSSKIYGPRGIALLYIKKHAPLYSLMPGGGQERGMRGGTEATSLIVGFAKAVEETVSMRNKENPRLQKIMESAKRELTKRIPKAKLLGHPNSRLPNNFSFSIPGIESDYLVLALSAKHIYASSRSSCSSDTKDEGALDSHVILAIGGEPTDGTVRLSFGRDTKEKDILNALKVTAEAVKKWESWAHAHKQQAERSL